MTCCLLTMSLVVIRNNIMKWDMAETAKGGPFQEILDGELVGTLHPANKQPLPLTMEPS